MQNVSEAYRNGDLNKIRFLEIKVDEKGTDKNQHKTTVDELKVRISKVLQYIEKLMEEIEKIKGAFPFIIADKLSDPQWVLAENNTTLNSISSTMDEREHYKKAIAALTEISE